MLKRSWLLQIGALLPLNWISRKSVTTWYSFWLLVRCSRELGRASVSAVGWCPGPGVLRRLVPGPASSGVGELVGSADAQASLCTLGQSLWGWGPAVCFLGGIPVWERPLKPFDVLLRESKFMGNGGRVCFSSAFLLLVPIKGTFEL